MPLQVETRRLRKPEMITASFEKEDADWLRQTAAQMETSIASVLRAVVTQYRKALPNTSKRR